ncbi:hypothetical protein ruthe_01011 [Rubellimicrobium thermophilum DSM 16684]|uniref:Uncharacterized protein n=1 Tax=Rubellimicrobium thermophilum DSM 16684 TaxID=1123069 RepID=S9QXV7_9RHOB|nr:hypothetical protein [Rubellimicrobium thermophilum]EPX86201.1 hypothetical protein ruthe_01011 [Rubellimicrobium thermophilum DSM 16684]
MGVIEDLADALARDVIAAAEELGDEQLIAEIGSVLGASSPTTQEAFMTSVRVRLAERRARRVLAERLSAAATARQDSSAPSFPTAPGRGGL